LRPLDVIKGWNNDELSATRTTLRMTMYQFARRRSTKKHPGTKKTGNVEAFADSMLKDVSLAGSSKASRCKAPEIPRSEAYIRVRRNDEE
jgi:hypothetical protein